MRILLVALSSSALFLAACGSKESDKTATTKSIGAAEMSSDGTITLRLRAEVENGYVGEAVLTYKKDDPKYQEVLEHLGGMKPGESKSVPPWQN